MSARCDSTFVQVEVERLLKLGCIREVETRPMLVLPLSSVFSKKKRVVVDASRWLNSFLQHRTVRLSDHRDTADLIQPMDYFITEDLDSGKFLNVFYRKANYILYFRILAY